MTKITIEGKENGMREARGETRPSTFPIGQLRKGGRGDIQTRSG
jgi:hypothetical protein